jgi:hypothetical protein
MKKMGFVLVVLALVGAQGAVAQSSGGLKAKGFDLTIIVDAFGADIYVDNTLVTGNVARVAPGVHSVRVRAEGSYDFMENVNVTSDRTLVVRMRQRTYPVTIRVNAANPAIFVDGERIAGSVATLSAGAHTVRVAADGYEDSVTSINVAAPMVIDVTLEQSGYLLTVNANIKTARVIVNGVSRGTVPFSEYLPPGTYTVKVTARGYTDYVASVALDGPVAISASLAPGQPGGGGTAFLTFVVPPEFTDPEMRERDLGENIRIYIDGRLANPKRELDRIPVAPGRHSIRVASGVFSIQVGEIEFFAGTSYTFELAMDVSIRGERKAGGF